MSSPDPRGNPCGTRNAAALAAAETALWRMMSFYDVPLADLDQAIAADPGWALPHVMKAGFLASLTEPSMLGQAQAHLQAPCAAGGVPLHSLHRAAQRGRQPLGRDVVGVMEDGGGAGHRGIIHKPRPTPAIPT